MLTAIPPSVLHYLQTRLRALLATVELGLALTCPCGGDHGAGPALLGHDDPEPCACLGISHRDSCPEWVLPA